MNLEEQVVIQGLLKENVLLLFLPKSGGEIALLPPTPGSEGPEAHKK